jgi:deoxyxylulose-5-phosphate synthase
MPDVFLEHAKPEEQIAAAHLGAADIAATVLKALGQDSRGVAQAIGNG